MPRLKANDVPLTPEENDAVKAGIVADPDTFELDDEWFARARPAVEVVPHLVEAYRRGIAERTGHKRLAGNALARGDNNENSNQGQRPVGNVAGGQCP